MLSGLGFFWRSRTVSLLVALLTCSSASMLASQSALGQPGNASDTPDSVAQFYKGKQITFVVGIGVGGGYDLLARLMARHIGKHIPGNPHLVVQNVPTANSLVAANNLYNTLPKDGTHIGLLIRNMLLAPITNPAGVRFQVEKFNWIGSLASETSVALAWHTAPVKTIDDLFRKDPDRWRDDRSRSGDDTKGLQCLDQHQVQDCQRIQGNDGYRAGNGTWGGRGNRRLVVEQCSINQA